MSPRIRHAVRMTLEEKAKRRQKIVTLHRAGSSPSSIGNYVGVTADYVRILLRELGETVPEHTDHHIAPMWDMDEERRREAIVRRASQGARATILANEEESYPRYPQGIPATHR